VVDNSTARTAKQALRRALQSAKPFFLAMLALPERMGRDDLTAHGFRSTFPDWAAERTNFPREVVEMALAHTIESKVEAAYRRGDLFQKRRQLMDAWARFCMNRPMPARGKFRSALG
jgi:integrase